MPLTAQDAFKAGYLARCVEDGLSPDEIAGSVKVASDLLEKQGLLDKLLGSALDVGKGVAGTAAHYGIPAAILAPPILGAAGGYGLAKLTDIDDRDVADIKDREVIDEYHRQTEKLQRRKAVRDFLKNRQTSGRMFLGH